MIKPHFYDQVSNIILEVDLFITMSDKTKPTVVYVFFFVNLPVSEEMSALAVLCKLWQLWHHPNLQAAWLLQGQSRVAGLAEALGEGTQQLAATGIVKRQTAQLVIQQGSNSLRCLSHKNGGLNAIVQ